MKIRHVSIKNFRGIRELEWDIQSDIVCPHWARRFHQDDGIGCHLTHTRPFAISELQRTPTFTKPTSKRRSR